MIEIDDSSFQKVIRHIQYADRRIARHEAEISKRPTIPVTSQWFYKSAEKNLVTAREIKNVLVELKNQLQVK